MKNIIDEMSYILKRSSLEQNTQETLENLDKLASSPEGQRVLQNLEQNLMKKQDLDSAQSLENLAKYYLENQRYDSAELLLRSALITRKGILPEHHPDILRNLRDLAWFYCSQQSYSEAKFYLGQALEICKHNLGESHPETVLIHDSLTMLQS
ncbi:MAG: tetratricopeptide repeat protein [Bacteroidota bacterium]